MMRRAFVVAVSWSLASGCGIAVVQSPGSGAPDAATDPDGSAALVPSADARTPIDGDGADASSPGDGGLDPDAGPVWDEPPADAGHVPDDAGVPTAVADDAGTAADGGPTGTSLLENGDFEADDNNADGYGWKSWHERDERRVRGAGVSGSFGCLIPGALGPPESSRRTIVEQLGVPASEGRRYRIAMSIRTEDVGSQARGNIYFVDEAGEHIGGTRVVGRAVGTTPWTRYDETFLAPGGTVAINLHLRVFHLQDGAGAGAEPGTGYFDDVRVTELP